MKINDYYLQELHALRHSGVEFAKENPGLSPYLAKEGQDPDVERLLEGFAFLSGRLRQQMDEELPELSHNLIQLLWPNYVRPIPSMSIIKYDSLIETTQAETVDKGTMVLSSKKGMNTCKFQTCYETKVEAYQLKEVSYTVQGDKSTLEFDFGMTSVGSMADMILSSVRLHLCGAKLTAKELYLFLSCYVSSVSFDLLDDEGETLVCKDLPLKGIQPFGFDKQSTILPYPRNVFDGYALLQEYFCFENKYYFVTVDGLDILQQCTEEDREKSRKFRISIGFDKRLPEAYKPAKNDFALYCTPIINLFQTDATPIRKTALEDEYMVVASDYILEESEVFAVEKVRGWIPSKNRYENYEHFESFKEDKENFYYSSRVKLSNNGKRTHTFLRFAGSEGMYEDINHSEAMVSVKFLSTNCNLPSKLEIGTIDLADPLSSVSHLKFKNITVPSISYVPPIEGDFLWKIISNMSLNYLSLTDISTLKTILQTYDFLGAYDVKQKQRIEYMMKGILSIDSKQGNIIFEGLPIRGVVSSFKIDATKFASKGEMYLFFNVVNEFFSLYGNVNTYHQLRVETLESEIFEWPVKMGYHTLI